VNLAEQIGGLADADYSSRQTAARSIFAAAAENVAPLLREWMSDPALASCLDTPAGPQLTAGVAVPPKRFDEIREVNGSPRLADVPPDQDAKEFELNLPGGIRLDILTSRDPDGSGAIARYLRKFGEGIQQIEVDTNDVDRATEILRTRFGVEPIYPATRAGADGTRVNFFLVALPGGSKLLIELVSAG
jgi:hypothetical protein